MAFEVMKALLCNAPPHPHLIWNYPFVAKGHFVTLHHSQLNLHKKTALALNKILHSSQFYLK